MSRVRCGRGLVERELARLHGGAVINCEACMLHGSRGPLRDCKGVLLGGTGSCAMQMPYPILPLPLPSSGTLSKPLYSLSSFIKWDHHTLVNGS